MTAVSKRKSSRKQEVQRTKGERLGLLCKLAPCYKLRGTLKTARII